MIRRCATLLLALGCLAVPPALAADMSSVPTLAKPSATGAAWTPAGVANLRRDLDATFAKAPALRGAHAGLLAVDSRTGAVLYSRLADDDFMPASNFKVLTGSAALARLGRSFTFKTSVLAAPNGDLVLRGGGDPLLLAKDLDAAAAAVASGGTRSVNAIVADASYFDAQRYAPGWSWDDFPYYYAVPVSALSLEENVLHVKVLPGATAGSAATLETRPATTSVTLENRITTGAPKSKDTVDIERDGNLVRLTGSIAVDAKPDDIEPAVPDPEAYAADVFRQALLARGVAVTGGFARGQAPPDARVLWTHDSEPLPQLLADFWYPSDNLLGEVLLKSLGVARGGAPGTAAAGIELENEYLRSIGVDPATVAIADGSGLSAYNRITPRALVAILQADWKGPDRDAVLDALPVAGVRGSLASRYLKTPAERRVFAKTGYISHVSTLSGYIATRRHGAVTFSFLVGDLLGTTEALRALHVTVLSRFVTD